MGLRKPLILGLAVVMAMAGCTGHDSSKDKETDADRGAQGEFAPDGVLRFGVPVQVGDAENPAHHTFAITAFAPLAVAADPAVEGSMYYRLGMKVTIQPGRAAANVSLGNFSVGPSRSPEDEDDGRAHADQAGEGAVSAQTKAVIAAACRGLNPLDESAEAAGSHSSGEGSWSLTPGKVKPFTGCLTFRYQGTPTGFAYLAGDRASEGKPNAWWPLRLPAPSAKARPMTLATFNGTGKRLLMLSSAAQAPGAKVCWSMTGEGKNVIDTQSDAAGANLENLVSAVGPTGQCENNQTLRKFLRVSGSRDWSITVTSY